ncbi:hypothetical protein Halhy_3705 [Haliscomenobacter hydrossis DSM 1100]|uniref:Uncharacterized protein n=1 Tax=Haliscomenobacter hydrossis (strain ATCC 27775 / DSM 1100 / LMG 10767 / O) TaxID=760192 RepID=F4KZY7_HALH1|nr:hypothetical protein Halhy_3705 [Haliscomenobacter hydrossis DSM 1100]
MYRTYGTVLKIGHSIGGLKPAATKWVVAKRLHFSGAEILEHPVAFPIVKLPVSQLETQVIKPEYMLNTVSLISPLPVAKKKPPPDTQKAAFLGLKTHQALHLFVLLRVKIVLGVLLCAANGKPEFLTQSKRSIPNPVLPLWGYCPLLGFPFLHCLCGG